jgi:predicted RNA-binding protein
MCLARVQFVNEEKDQARDAIEDVAIIERTPDGLEVTNLLGAVTKLEGEIQSIDFMESLVSIKKTGSVLDRAGRPGGSHSLSHA